jgi:hypothetical protein
VPVPQLEPVARRVLVTSCINALDSGFTLPFLLISLHAVPACRSRSPGS